MSLAVPGEDPFAQALRSELPATLRAEGVFRGVEVVESVLSVASGPALLVEVPHRDILWTPLHARGKITVKVVYASNGDLSWRDEATVHMDNRDGSVLRARGELQMEDVTSGVVSQLHYYGHLGSLVAAEVAKSLHGSVKDPVSPPQR